MAETKTEIKPETKSIEKLSGTSVADAELIKSMGYYVCSKCNSQYRTDMSGNLFCPIGDKDCPTLKL